MGSFIGNIATELSFRQPLFTKSVLVKRPFKFPKFPNTNTYMSIILNVGGHLNWEKNKIRVSRPLWYHNLLIRSLYHWHIFHRNSSYMEFPSQAYMWIDSIRCWHLFLKRNEVKLWCRSVSKSLDDLKSAKTRRVYIQVLHSGWYFAQFLFKMIG